MSETATSYTECVCAHVLSSFRHALVRDIQLCWGTFQHTQASSLFNNFVSPTSSVRKKSSPTNSRTESQTTESPSTRRNTINVRWVWHVPYVDVSRSVQMQVLHVSMLIQLCDRFCILTMRMHKLTCEDSHACECSTPAAPETRRAIPKVSPQQASSSGIESEVESLARQLAELERYART